MTTLSVHRVSGATQVFIPAVAPVDIRLGLSDYQTDEHFDPPYCQQNYMPRNWPSRPDIPEVLQLTNGDVMGLIPAWEWVWWWMFRLSAPNVSEQAAKSLYAKYTRSNAAFTNGAGSDKRGSVVLRNGLPGAMRIGGVDCPGGNVYKAAGDPVMVRGEMCLPIWCLDYGYPPSDPQAFAASLPAWLRHTAKTVHPERIGEPIEGAPNGVFLVTTWDYDFPCPPLLTKVGRQAVIDGFHCRENFIRLVRIKP
jgi:hypothetical protein